MDNIGTRIKEIRTLKQLKQSTVAMALGISLTAYSDIETGKTSNITFQRIVQIAEVLKVPPVEIIYSEKSENELLKRIKELKQIIEEREQEVKRLSGGG